MNTDHEILSSRVFKAPPESVFEAWTNPDLLKIWWGPKDFTNTFEVFEPKPGGTWRFVMHGPGGVGNYKNEVVFETVDKPNLIVWNRVSKPLFRVVASFEETAEANTLLTFRMQFGSKEECDKIRPFAPEKNEENFDRLEAVLSNSGK